MTKQAWLDAAEVFDFWRVVPRLVLIAYGIWLARVTDSLMLWFQHLPAAERTAEAAAFAGAVITAVTGLAVWIFRIYSDNGRDLNQASSATTETAVTTTRTTT